MPVLGAEWYVVVGEDVQILFAPDVEPMNIAGWVLRWQLRPADGSATIAINKDNVGGGGLNIVDARYGLIQVNIYKNDTLNLQLQTGPWYWELRRANPGASTALAKGSLIIDSANAVP